jgi:phytoene dehydrogenase-like protein
MNKKTNDSTIAVIGAGFAGLAAGIYARLNGYDVHIFEMHDLPGGLCTSWDRKGYTFDCCIHWLVGSAPSSGMHDLWEETGIAKDMKITDMDLYMRFEGSDGRTLDLYTDVDRLEKKLLEFSPQDATPIKKFIDGIRMCIPFEMPSKHDHLLRKIAKQAKMAVGFMKAGKKMKEWMNITCGDFASEFKDPMLSKVIREMWVPEFSMLFMLFTFSYMHNKNAGYPAGGSMPMSKALETRFRELGGKLNYNSKVRTIITEDGKAKGIILENGTEITAERIISAADGHSTLFDMLGRKYGDAKTFEPYDKWPLFPPLIFVSLGVRRKFNDVPLSVSGLIFALKEPVQIGDRIRDNLSVHLYNHDPSMAPEGCTSITIMLETDYEYWNNLAVDRKLYKKKKEEISRQVVELLEQRFPGISSQVEVTDVATPLTFIRYTGNWQGSFEGWLLTPENAGVMMKPMPQTIPGLKNFYMCGQWVEPGGGLPTAVMSARRLIKRLCREDGKKFRTD